MKILIVEDDQIFGETLKIFLELEGCDVDCLCYGVFEEGSMVL